MSSYWANAPYRQRVKPVGSIPANPIPPASNAPSLNVMPGARPGAEPTGAGPAGLGGGYDPDVLARAWGIIDPQLKSAADIINRRSQMGSGYISGLTNALQGSMGQISGQVSGAYGPEVDLAKGIAGYAQGSLTGAGRAQGASLNTALTQAGGKQGAIAGSSDLNLTKEGAGAGGAAYGTGIAELDNLIASRAASQTRAALEPSFAAMTGQQNQMMLAQQMARQLADQQSAIQATVPQLLSDLQDKADARAIDLRDYTAKIAIDRRDYAEKVREFNLGVRADSAAAAAKAGSAADTQAYNYAKNTAAVFTKESGPTGHVYVARRTKNGWEVADMGAKSGQTKPQRAVFKQIGSQIWALDPITGDKLQVVGNAPPKTPKGLTYKNVGGTIWGLDAQGNKVAKVGPAGTPATPKTGKLPTPGQTNTLVDTWYHGKPQPAKRVQRTDPKTGKPMWTAAGQPIYVTQESAPTGQLGYQEAYKRLRAMNYSDEKARSYLDTNWKRGERGRPWVSAPERQALTTAKVRPSALFYRTFSKGKSIWHGYLNAAQVTALKAAKMLPAGEMVNGRYYIKPGLV